MSRAARKEVVRTVEKIEIPNRDRQNADLKALMTLPEDARDRLVMIALGMTLTPEKDTK